MRRQSREYGKGFKQKAIVVDPPLWEEYKAMCEELGISASAGLRQLMKRAVRGYKANG